MRGRQYKRNRPPPEDNRDETPPGGGRNRALVREIQMIAGGFTGGGITRSGQKAYAGQARYREVYLAERASKRQKSCNNSLVISFREAD